MITRMSHGTFIMTLGIAFLLLLVTAAASAGSHPRPDRPAPCPADTGELTKGKFLVASRDLLDPNFHETVVVLADYGENGAAGLIINRPTRVTLAQLLPSEEWLRPRNDTIYIGGPVAQDRLILLIRSTKRLAGAHSLFDDVYISGSSSTLRSLMDADMDASFRAYMGYAGWGPGQLESEVERGDWRVLPAEADAIFEHPAGSIWEKLIEHSMGEWAFDALPVPTPPRRHGVESAARALLSHEPLAPARAAVQKGLEERAG